jgi:prepilin peptidase CpaA
VWRNGRWQCHQQQEGYAFVEVTLAIPIVVVVVATMVASVTDLRQLKVRNGLTLPLLASGPVYHLASGGMTELNSSLLGAAFGCGILLLPYLLGGLGGGDVKLMSGVGAWLGMPTTVYVFVFAGLIAAVYSMVILVWRGGLGRVLTTCQMAFFQLRSIGKHLGPEDRIETVVTRGDRWSRVVPFALMIALAVIIVLICGAVAGFE